MLKRNSDAVVESHDNSKKSRSDDLTVVISSNSQSAMVTRTAGRSSNLQAPTMLLTGHEAAIYSVSFSPSGNNLASSCYDGKIYLWEVFGDCKNYNVIVGHKNAILEVKWPTENSIVSASADKTLAVWDANKATRVRKFAEHSGIVNSVCFSKDAPHILGSGSDDCNAKVWDSRSKRSSFTLTQEYQILATALSNDGAQLYTGGIDNIIRRWDLRMPDEPAEDLVLSGHGDSVTGLAVSPDGNYLFSNAMDQSARIWNTKPFVDRPDARCEHVLQGLHHGAEKNLLRCSWSPSQDKVACGSADRIVHIWDPTTGAPMYHLPGHKGSVNDVVFHPSEPIIASCGTDKQIFLGELS